MQQCVYVLSRTLAASWKTIVSPHENSLFAVELIDIDGTNCDVLHIAVAIEFGQVTDHLQANDH